MNTVVLAFVCFLLRQEFAALEVVSIPDDLLFGAASSAYQVEGAWNEDGKGESNWDRMVHSKPEKIIDRSTGDIACDSYHNIKEDVKIMKDLGLQFYRFSLSWSRILPTGFSNRINKAGINYYNELIDELLANNILPMVTLFHWDLPQPLQELGGFLNPEIATWFKYYAHVVFKHFGDRVKSWITINEPKQICEFGYGSGMYAPAIASSEIGSYMCIPNVLKAHAEVYHVYDKFYRPKQNGSIGITIECIWTEPFSNSTADAEAAERKLQFDFGIYTHPIYHGDYPEIVKDFVAKRSESEGFPKSRLPALSPEDVEFIKGTSDFFGLNHYTSFKIKDKQDDPIGVPSFEKDSRLDNVLFPNTFHVSYGYFTLVPSGFRNILNYIKVNYGNPDIYITETGVPDFNELEDTNRIKFYGDSLNAVLEAISEDNVRIKVYTAWSLMDNYEWGFGYTFRFGLYQVNFTDPKRTRTSKASAKFYKDVIASRELLVNTKTP